MPGAYGIENGTEEIEGDTYQTSYLGEIQNFLRVGEKEYNTFEKALDSIDTEGTIEVIASVSISEEILIPSTKSVTMDLAGNQIINTKMLSNEGKLRIIDSSEDSSGSYTNTSKVSSEYGIKSTNEIVFESGTINSSGNARNIYISGKGKITGGIYSAAQNNNIYIATDTMEITGGTYNINAGGYDAIVIGEGKTVNISGIEVNGSGRGIYCSQNSNLLIENSRINTGSTAIYNMNGRSMTIRDGEYIGGLDIRGNMTTIGDPEDPTKVPIIRKSTSGAVGIASNGTVNIYNGELSGNEGITVSTSHGPTINIYNGTITGMRGVGIHHRNGKLNIYGGKVVGTSYGIQVDRNANLNIGNNEDEVQITTPEIIGEQYGLYISGNVSFYDGILEGKTAGYYGTVSNLPEHYILVADTEVIGEENYNINYLSEAKEFVRNGDKHYSNLQSAIDEATNGDTLIIIDDALVFEPITVISDKEISIDLNNHQLGMNQTITNNGNIVIMDHSDVKNNKLLMGGNSILINNKGTLRLDDISLENVSTLQYIIYNYGTVTLNHVTSNSKAGIRNESSCEINNSNLHATNDYTFYNYSKESDTVVLNNNTISSDSLVNHGAIYNQSASTININGGTLGKVYNKNSVMNVVGVNSVLDYTQNGTHASFYNDSGTLKLKNSEISNFDHSVSYDSAIYGVRNNGSLEVSNTVFNISSTHDNAQVYGISSQGNGDHVILKDSTFNISGVNSLYVYGISKNGNISSSSGEFSLSDNIININQSKSGYGIYIPSSGGVDINMINNNIDVVTTNDAYGLYSAANTNVVLESGTIVANGKNAYGIYIDSGTVTMGIHDGDGTENAAVSIESPLVKAIGTTLGVGVKKFNGYFNYYDGRIIGSTNAKPETTTNTEYNYGAVFSIDDETGYEHCILKYIK